MKLRKRPQNKTNKRLPVAIIATTVVLATTYGVVAYTQSFWPFQSETASSEESDEIRPPKSVDYSPPTEEELENSQEGKKNSAENKYPEDVDPTSNNPLSTTPVAIAFAEVVGENLEIRAFIPQVIEGSGTCTATLKKGDLTVTESSKAFVDASSSQCEPILIPTSRFSQPGGWSLTVSYISETSKGTSETMKISI